VLDTIADDPSNAFSLMIGDFPDYPVHTHVSRSIDTATTVVVVVSGPPKIGGGGVGGFTLKTVVSVAERNNHGATLDGVGPRRLSRGVFLLLDSPVARHWDYALQPDSNGRSDDGVCGDPGRSSVPGRRYLERRRCYEDGLTCRCASRRLTLMVPPGPTLKNRRTPFRIQFRSVS
jgi:hypothetical protein